MKIFKIPSKRFYVVLLCNFILIRLSFKNVLLQVQLGTGMAINIFSILKKLKYTISLLLIDSDSHLIHLLRFTFSLFYILAECYG